MLRFLPDLVVLLLMISLLLLASLRASFRPSELLVAWGDDGALPAVCYCGRSISGGCQFSVLCPGGDSAASQLLFELNKRGCRRLECVFVSSASPAPRGGRLLLRKKPVLSLVQLIDTRLQKPALDLLAEARFSGSATYQVFPHSGESGKRHQHWEFSSKRSKNGDLAWSFCHLREQVQVNLLWQKNGVLELRYGKRQENISTQQFPRRNRCGAWSSRSDTIGRQADIDQADWLD